MEEKFKKIIEEIKKENMDVQKTKDCIILIKRYLDKCVQGCEEDMTKEECVSQFLEEYENDVKVTDKYIDEVALGMAQYNVYNVLIATARSSKENFRRLVSQARSLSAPEEKQRNSANERELIIFLKSILRSFPYMKDEDLLVTIENRQKHTTNKLKGNIIESIQKHAGFLNEYGFLDKYIEETNEKLKNQGLENILLKKRNPLPDEIIDGSGNIMRYDQEGILRKYDENGNIIHDKDQNLENFEEDIGVVDLLDEEYLQKKSPEDLLLMDVSWKTQYFKERIEMSKAMSVIKFLDLWPMILNEEENAIQELDDETISNALKRDIAVTFLWKNSDIASSSSKIEEQYTKFVENMGMDRKLSLKDEINDQGKDLFNLASTSNHIVLEQCMIINKLQAKNFKDVKDWGVIEYREQDELEETDMANAGRIAVIAVENPNFRGVSILSAPEDCIRKFLNREDFELPKFKKINNIDEEYKNLMSKLYIPASTYYKKQVHKKYKEDPHSKLFANLAGKKVKKTAKKDETER